jgi:hypothetical protein
MSVINSLAPFLRQSASRQGGAEAVQPVYGEIEARPSRLMGSAPAYISG